MKSIQQSEEDSLELISGVPVPEATTDVVSLLFNSSSSEYWRYSVQLAFQLAFA